MVLYVHLYNFKFYQEFDQEYETPKSYSRTKQISFKGNGKLATYRSLNNDISPLKPRRQSNTSEREDDPVNVSSLNVPRGIRSSSGNRTVLIRFMDLISHKNARSISSNQEAHRDNCLDFIKKKSESYLKISNAI